MPRSPEPPSRMPGGVRIATLDGLRGFAVMGIVLMNVAAFAMPFAAYDNPAAYGPMRWPDVAAWAINLVLIDGKMRALFSALFGASLLLVSDRAIAAGRNAARVHLARMGWLLVFGLLHACLIWEGDILVLYALVGIIAFPLRQLSIERLLVLTGMLLALQAAILGLHYQGLAALHAAAAAPDALAGDRAIWAEVLDQIGRPAPAALAHDLALHRSPWRGLAAGMIATEPGAIATSLLFSGPETLGLMLLGMAGLRSAFLAGAWPAHAYRRAARICYGIGLPAMAAMAFMLWRWRFPPLGTSIAIDLAAMPFRWLIAIGHAALLIPWLARPSPLAHRIAAAGRCAFSNYLGTSLAMTALFYGWGFGLYGRVERWLLLPLALVVCGIILAWSRPWLARFAYGPLEWAWRSLARGRVAPLRRKAIAI